MAEVSLLELGPWFETVLHLRLCIVWAEKESPPASPVFINSTFLPYGGVWLNTLFLSLCFSERPVGFALRDDEI